MINLSIAQCIIGITGDTRHWHSHTIFFLYTYQSPARAGLGPKMQKKWPGWGL